jgi:hypothetical protein
MVIMVKRKHSTGRIAASHAVPTDVSKSVILLFVLEIAISIIGEIDDGIP